MIRTANITELKICLYRMKELVVKSKTHTTDNSNHGRKWPDGGSTAIGLKQKSGVSVHYSRNDNLGYGEGVETRLLDTKGAAIGGRTMQQL